MSEAVFVVDYDPAWPALFAAERDRLHTVFPTTNRIEHVGSTAVPGLAAKPIVDLLLGVQRLAEVEVRIPRIEALGWQYVPEHEAILPERRHFARPVTRPRTHHLHAVELGTPFWNDHLAFRDHLRAHPEDAQAYAALKRILAERYRHDRPGYSEAKTDFITAILARCR